MLSSTRLRTASHNTGHLLIPFLWLTLPSSSNLFKNFSIPCLLAFIPLCLLSREFSTLLVASSPSEGWPKWMGQDNDVPPTKSRDAWLVHTVCIALMHAYCNYLDWHMHTRTHHGAGDIDNLCQAVSFHNRGDQPSAESCWWCSSS